MDRRITDTGPWVYYMLTYEPLAHSGELKNHQEVSLYKTKRCPYYNKYIFSHKLYHIYSSIKKKKVIKLWSGYFCDVDKLKMFALSLLFLA